MNEERIREEVALRLHTRERTVLRIACGNSPLNVSWGDLSEAWKEQFRAGATQILSIKGIRIEADNQDKPQNPYAEAADRGDMHAQSRCSGYYCAQDDMLTPKDGDVWRKVKEE